VDVQLALWQWIVAFVASAAVIMLAGTFLARAGDSIATRTRLGGLFVGMLLMASATSLPEIVTDVSAALAGAPDLAVADLFGSSMANMAILGLLDLTSRRNVWPGIELGHARVGAIAITLTALIVLGVISPTGIRIGWLGIEPIVVAIAYVGAAAWIGRSEPAQSRAAEAPSADGVDELLTPIGWAAGEGSLRRDLVTFGLAAVAILVSGPSLAISAQGIAEETGVAQTFIGITLLAVATSLPELVASLAAIQIGAHDLAVGNLFGSNAFNMTIVLWVDLAYTDGPVLDAISIGQMVPGIGAILMMALAIGAIVSGTGTRLRRGEPDAVLLILAYFGLLALSWIGVSSA
jgi:cation:H+ antiporter